MITEKLRAPCLLAALSTVLVSVAAHAGGPRTLPVGPRTLPVGPVKVGPIQVGPANAPPTIGWPHDIRSAQAVPCRAASPGEVILTVYDNSCLSLTPGFYATLNAVSFTSVVKQINVGSGVRARTFWLEHFSQNMDRAFIMYTPGTNLPLNGDAQTIRSMRVEPANRSMVCNDLQEGEIALFEGWDGGGDCVVIPVNQYSSADAMGIANDSISGVNNNTGTNAILFFNASFNKQGYVVKQHTRVARLPEGGHFSDSIDNQTSSMQMLPP